jgi:DNA-binding NtrC family response regulator
MMLRFLETGEIQRVGSDRALPPLDVRVITATHRQLLDRVADKSFREDLYYRLNVIHICVPALRERVEDVPLLMAHCLRESARAHRVPEPMLSQAVLGALMAYHWPGNVRELKNIAERLVLRGSDRTIDLAALPAEIRGARPAPPAVVVPERPEAVVANHDTLFRRMVHEGQPFWSAVYEPFVARDLTRHDIREVVRLGLAHTRGNYKLLVTCFNMPPEDYKRFLNFLRKYQCHVPFQRFRTMSAPVDTTVETPAAQYVGA